MKVLVCPGCRGAPARGTGQRRGALEAGSPRASGICSSARECNREAKGLPQLLSTDKTSVQVSSSRTPSTSRAEGQSLQRFPRVMDKGFWHHHSLSVDSGAPACLPPCPQAAAMFCQSAGARGAARTDGLPEVLRGGYTHLPIRSPRTSPAHPVLLPGEQPQGPLRAAGVGWQLGTPRFGTPLPSSR